MGTTTKRFTRKRLLMQTAQMGQGMQAIRQAVINLQLLVRAMEHRQAVTERLIMERLHVTQADVDAISQQIDREPRVFVAVS